MPATDHIGYLYRNGDLEIDKIGLVVPERLDIRLYFDKLDTLRTAHDNYKNALSASEEIKRLKESGQSREIFDKIDEERKRIRGGFPALDDGIGFFEEAYKSAVGDIDAYKNAIVEIIRESSSGEKNFAFRFYDKNSISSVEEHMAHLNAFSKWPVIGTDLLITEPFTYALIISKGEDAGPTIFDRFKDIPGVKNIQNYYKLFRTFSELTVSPFPVIAIYKPKEESTQAREFRDLIEKRAGIKIIDYREEALLWG